MTALELSMAQPELEQGMSHDYESLGHIEERPHLKSDTYWIHTIDNGQVFESMLFVGNLNQLHNVITLKTSSIILQ